VKKLLRNYGMILVLFGLGLLFSVLTLKEQTPESSKAVEQLLSQITHQFNKTDLILTVGAVNKESASFANQLKTELANIGFSNIQTIIGIPRDLRIALERIQASGQKLKAIATSGDVQKWRVLELLPHNYPDLRDCQILLPKIYLWPDFLKDSNLLAIVDRIVVIAVIAIGMTMVIIAGGIDLSVGSLIAVSAVFSTLVMKKMGGQDASGWIVLLGFLVGIFASGLIGGFGGYLVARFKVPPFITTLGIMLAG